VQKFSSERIWIICGFLFLGTVLNYLDRQVLSLTAEKIIREYHLTNESFGYLLAAFRHSYAILQIGGGWLVDRFGPRIIYPVAVAVWSSAGMLSGVAGTVGSLSACRALLGAAEAFNWPCALKVTQRLVPAGMRAFANGLFNSGMAAGAVLAPLIITVLTLRFGFRTAFVVTGALGFVWLSGWLAITRRNGESLGGTPSSVRASLAVLGSILLKREFWQLGVSAVAINCVLFFLADWIPLYLKTERGFSFRTGNLLTMITYAGLDAGNLACGLLVRMLVQTGKSMATARSVALMVNCVLLSAAILTGIVTNRYGALVCIAITAFGATGFQVIYLTLVQDLDPKNVGAAAGLLGGLGNLAYGLASPYIGHLADLHQTPVIFAVLGVLPWLAFVAISGVVRSAAER